MVIFNLHFFSLSVHCAVAQIPPKKLLDVHKLLFMSDSDVGISSPLLFSCLSCLLLFFKLFLKFFFAAEEDSAEYMSFPRFYI